MSVFRGNAREKLMARDINPGPTTSCMRFVAQVGRGASFARDCFLGMFRPPYDTAELLTQMDELGAKSLPVVGATGLVTGLILAIQSRPVLARFGAESYVPAMVSISVVRELGPILTALMVAGRVGSGMSAELGSMRVTEQIDAIEVAGIDSFRFLVVTRVIACTLLLPLLTAIVNILAILGAYLPAVPGVGILADAGIPQSIVQVGSTEISVELYGNDVIEPLNQTFYDIAILDTAGDVVQRGCYQFTGSETVDLSTQQPMYPGPLAPQPGGYVETAFSATPVFNGAGWSGPIVFDITLTGNVTSSTLVNIRIGQFVMFFIEQDGIGNHTFTWPANVANPTLVDATPNSTTTAAYVMRANGTMYPWNGWS